MGTRSVNALHRAVLTPEGANPTDGELLERFVRQRDEAAFEALIHRHGAMVIGAALLHHKGPNFKLSHDFRRVVKKGPSAQMLSKRDSGSVAL